MARKPHVPAESGETLCSACGATIRAPASPRRRRVQCPKCREVVFLEGTAAPLPAPAPTPDAAPEESQRLALLEARVEALEAALRDSMAAARPATAGTGPRKLLWMTTEPGQAPHFSTEQGLVLFHNLGSVRTQAITIRTPAGDTAAREHAEWFKAVFERAGWTVRGPEEIPPDTATGGLSLAVPELPVAREAAATYFALKAAGFEATTILDAALARDTRRDAAAMALTLPPEKAA